MSKAIFPQKDLGSSWILLSNLVGPKSGTMFSGVMDFSTWSENHEHEDYSDAWQVKAKSD